jgi:sterol desaturase/sphingolipid hydroxylase (fatty acid hydroxylase superfamily)
MWDIASMQKLLNGFCWKIILNFIPNNQGMQQLFLWGNRCRLFEPAGHILKNRTFEFFCILLVNFKFMKWISIFGAEPISFRDLLHFKSTVPEIIVWAAPFMFFFVLLEFCISHYQNRKYYEPKETFSSIIVGIGNIAISLLIKLILFYAAVWIYNQLPWRMSLNWWTFIPCYILYDLCSYFAHYISHNQRFWWATHVVHHSGEHYNLTVSFRLSWVQYSKIIFFAPLFLVGFHVVIFFVVNQVSILFQFWVHTEYIRKLPRFFEYVFATPSNHRVHHGVQEKYINKNYGATFILWDRIFGTYQPEEEPVEYGITSNIKKHGNPVYVNFHEFSEMFRDVKSAKGIRRKLFFIFGSPDKIARYKQLVPENEQIYTDQIPG